MFEAAICVQYFNHENKSYKVIYYTTKCSHARQGRHWIRTTGGRGPQFFPNKICWIIPAVFSFFVGANPRHDDPISMDMSKKIATETVSRAHEIWERRMPVDFRCSLVEIGQVGGLLGLRHRVGLWWSRGIYSKISYLVCDGRKASHCPSRHTYAPRGWFREKVWRAWNHITQFDTL